MTWHPTSWPVAHGVCVARDWPVPRGYARGTCSRCQCSRVSDVDTADVLAMELASTPAERRALGAALARDATDDAARAGWRVSDDAVTCPQCAENDG